MEKTVMNKMIELLNTLELVKSDKVKYENIRTEISNMFDSIMITYCNHTGIAHLS